MLKKISTLTMVPVTALTASLSAARAFDPVGLSTNRATAEQRLPVLRSSTGLHHAHQLISGTSPAAQTLYDQNANDKGLYVISDDIDDFSSYDNQAADDFTVPSNSTWIVKQVDVTGQYFNGSGPVHDVNLFIYKDNQGKPGKPAGECIGLIPARDFYGSFKLKLPRTCHFKLKGGVSGARYWLSVQANVYLDYGEWGWEVNSVQRGDQAMWQNPPGGFSVCETWETTENCLGSAYGPDLMFDLKGESKES